MFQAINKYSLSENKLPHTCIDHSRSDKSNCKKQSNEAVLAQI